MVSIQVHHQLLHREEKQTEILPLGHVFAEELLAVARFLLDLGRNIGEYVALHLVLKVKEELLRAFILITQLHNDRVCPHESLWSHTICFRLQIIEKHIGDEIGLTFAILDGRILDKVLVCFIHFVVIRLF